MTIAARSGCWPAVLLTTAPSPWPACGSQRPTASSSAPPFGRLRIGRLPPLGFGRRR